MLLSREVPGNFDFDKQDLYNDRIGDSGVSFDTFLLRFRYQNRGFLYRLPIFVLLKQVREESANFFISR